MKESSQLCTKFTAIIPVIMISCATFPHRSHEFVKRVIDSSQTDEQVRRVCELLLRRIVQYGTKDGVPTNRSLELAANHMGNSQGHDDFIRFTGLCLQRVLAEMEEPKDR